MTTTKEITKKGKLMDFSYETASKLFDIANGFLVLALFVGVVATYFIYITGNIKEDHVKEKLAESHDRSAKLEIEAASANERTAILEKETKTLTAEIAHANERAAEANKIAEGERLARIKIEAELAPRSISTEQMSGLTSRLKQYAGISIDILQIGESPEITHFRSLIETPLRAAGFDVFTTTAVGSGSFVGLSVGVFVDASESDKMAASALLSSLNAEGISAAYDGTFKRDNWPGFTMAPPGANKAPIRIYVGSKS
jgi:hypothetical protein